MGLHFVGEAVEVREGEGEEGEEKALDQLLLEGERDYMGDLGQGLLSFWRSV